MQTVLKLPHPIVLIDYHEEKSNVIKFLSREPIILRFVDLEIGDYIVSNRVCIERKTANDFISSIIDGRLFIQAKKLVENYKKPILIVEGDLNETSRNVNPRAITSALISLLTDYNINVLQTKNSKQTAEIIYVLAKREQEERKYLPIFKRRIKKFENEESFKEYIVSSLPGISIKLARRLLNYFGTVEKVFMADERDLMRIRGIGKKLAKRIRRILTSRYKGLIS